MKVSACDKSFCSLNKPVPKMTIDTPKGKIYFKEIDYNDFVFGWGFGAKPLAKFFINNFAGVSLTPDAKKFVKGTDEFSSKDYKKNVMDTMMRHQGIASNPDSIIYVGRNWWGKIVAGIIATPIRSISKYNDDEILYVDSLAISEDYRQSGVGKTLLKNLTPHIDEKFKKLFWVGYKTAIPFYEKLGFKQIDEKQYPEIVKHFAEQRVDYPEYEAFFMHELNPRVKG